MAYPNSNPSPRVDNAPFFASGTLTNGGVTTITFPTVTKKITIGCTSNNGNAAAVILVGVTTGGVAATERVGLPINVSIEMDIQTKQIVIAGAGDTVGYQLLAVLSRIPSDDYPDITAANGFAGVE